MSLRAIFTLLLLVFISEATKAKPSIEPFMNYENDTENWNILSSHALDDEDLNKALSMASFSQVLQYPNLVGMSEHQRIAMEQEFGGSWSCFTQTEPLHYSVLRRASIYLKSKLEAYDYVRIFCFK